MSVPNAASIALHSVTSVLPYVYYHTTPTEHARFKNRSNGTPLQHTCVLDMNIWHLQRQQRSAIDCVEQGYLHVRWQRFNKNEYVALKIALQDVEQQMETCVSSLSNISKNCTKNRSPSCTATKQDVTTADMCSTISIVECSHLPSLVVVAPCRLLPCTAWLGDGAGGITVGN